MRESKLVVRLAPEIKGKIEELSSKLGITQSAYCAYVLGQHIQAQEQMAGGIPKLQEAMVEMMKLALPPSIQQAE